MMKSRKPLAAIMAGGTGGHVFTGLAIAEKLRARQVEVFWLGTKRGFEAQAVPAADFRLYCISAAGVRKKKPVAALKASFALTAAFFSALRILLRHRPDFAIAMGGYAAVPGAFAALLCRIPLLIHEQNVVPGLANRVLAPFSKAALTGFPTRLVGTRTRWVGIPVRKSMQSANACRKLPGSNTAPLRLLVTGGSQGAAIFNRVVPEAIARIAVKQRPQVLIQTGVGKQEMVRDRARKLNVRLKSFTFVQHMTDMYAWADLLLCRAGASTIAEIMMTGVAAVLVPHPYVVDNHQEENARYLTSRGAATLLLEKNLTAQSLAEIIMFFHSERQRLVNMSKKAREMACPRAALDVAETAIGLIRK